MWEKLISPVSRLLEKIIPDKDKALEAKVQLAELVAKGDDAWLDVIKGALKSQQDLNMVDAQSNDKFRTRWRPALGWICVVGLGWEMAIRPFVVTAIDYFMDVPIVITSLDTEQIIGLVSTLLGMSALRTFEKLKGQQ